MHEEGNFVTVYSFVVVHLKQNDSSTPNIIHLKIVSLVFKFYLGLSSFFRTQTNTNSNNKICSNISISVVLWKRDESSESRNLKW